jgi:phosphatidylglycerophosphatase C
MGDMGEDRQPGAAFRPLVAFDFDGTLTWKDSFLAFLAWRAGRGAYVAGLAALAPAVASYLVDHDRGRLKAAAARRFLAGATRAEKDVRRRE